MNQYTVVLKKKDACMTQYCNL